MIRACDNLWLSLGANEGRNAAMKSPEEIPAAAALPVAPIAETMR